MLKEGRKKDVFTVEGHIAMGIVFQVKT